MDEDDHRGRDQPSPCRRPRDHIVGWWSGLLRWLHDPRIPSEPEFHAHASRLQRPVHPPRDMDLPQGHPTATGLTEAPPMVRTVDDASPKLYGGRPANPPQRRSGSDAPGTGRAPIGIETYSLDEVDSVPNAIVE